MKTRSTNEKSPLLKAITILLIACMLSGNAVVADGTKEIFSELGLYTGEPSGSYCADLYQWSFYGPDSAKINANFQGVTGIPEGTKVLRVESTNRWAGCGVFFPNCDNPAAQIDYDFSDYTNGHIRFFLMSTNVAKVEIEFVSTLGANTKAVTNIASTSNIWREIVIPLSHLRWSTTIILPHW